MGNCLSRRRRQSSALIHDPQPPAVPDLSHECVEHVQGEETTGAKDELQHVSSSSGAMDENKEIVITSIRATDVTLGLRRLPAGFYIVVRHGSLEWRTEHKCSSVDDNVEWNDSIPMPLDLSATVHLVIYAPFELQPTLGAGEELRELTTTVEQLLDHSTTCAPFRFSPKDGDVVSPCSSLSITLRRRSDDNDSSVASVLRPYSSTTESGSELEEATNYGHNALSRYQRDGDRRDLDRSIEEFGRALSVCPMDDPCRAATQSNLAMAKLILYLVGDADTSLEVPLDLLRNALDIRSVGHVDRPSTLIHLATVHLVRFEKLRDGDDETRARGLLHEAIELSSGDSHVHQVATFILQLSSGGRVGPMQADDESSVEQDSTSPLMDEDLGILGVRLLDRFKQLGDLDDLQRAIGILEELVRSTSSSDDRHIVGLQYLGVALSYRFGRLGQLSDLEDAIANQSDSVNLTLDGPDKSGRLNNLGNTLLTRFSRLGQLSDLEVAMSTLRNAVDVAPHGHPSRPACLNNLGNSFLTRFLRLGQLSDLDEAIVIQSDAVDLASHDHPDKPSRLNNLGSSFLTRFDRLEQLRDLEDAISMLSAAIDLAPHGDPYKPAYLNNLGKSFVTRFLRLGQLNDLEDAISKQSDAVDLTPDGHPDKPSRLYNLGTSYRIRFSRLGRLTDLEDAISRQRDSIDLTPHCHPNRPGRLNNLSISLITRFEHLGELNDVEEAISRQKDAVDLIPDGHPDKPALLDSLGISFRTRFSRLDQLNDLEDAISRQRDAIRLVPLDHPDRPGHLNSLGHSLVIRFERLGELSDLEDGISMLRDAVDLSPPGHPRKSTFLNVLGHSYRTRFLRLGELDDVQDSISALRDAVDLAPHGHPHIPSYLGNLGNTLRSRFECLGQLGDLENAISRQRDAVDLTPDSHPYKPFRLGSLGNSFFTRFSHIGELSDLEDAISVQRNAVDLTPHGHPDRAALLSNLGNSLITRFGRVGQLSDLDDGIWRQRDAVALTPHGHPHKSSYLSNLGNSFQIHFEHFGELRSLEHAISLYSHAASSPIGPINVRFRASQSWISCARQVHHPSLLHAYSVALNLLPQLAWIGLSLVHRYDELTQAADLVREAAAAALDEGLSETAVEWLEQGRSIVWGELFQLRSSYEELSSTHPDHARRLQEISVALDHATATHEHVMSATPEQSQGLAHHATESSKQAADKHRRLAIERDKLLQEIRRLPGFQGFLLHREFSLLRASAHSGPVVILNAAETRCDTLIVLADVDHVIHVPLPKFTFKRATDLQTIMKNFVRDAREGKRETLDAASWESILSPLWKCVVRPVLDAVAVLTPGDLSRIFWCPTGPFMFLPIHAAGFYDERYLQPGNKIFDFVVSSYIPTLSILAPSPNPNVLPTIDLHLLVVPQPPSDGQGRLPGVLTELSYIRDIVESSPSARINLMESSLGTVEEVLDLLRRTDWCHFACHGIQDGVDSGLCLADGRRLRLRDILAVSRPRGGLAFLSACQTATGEKNLSDEAIHVAAGMLFAGYGGVVGTMWSISDRLAPIVARDVYGHLFRNGMGPDYRDAARALHEAIGYVRENDQVSFSEWVPFIHVGL